MANDGNFANPKKFYWIGFLEEKINAAIFFLLVPVYFINVDILFPFAVY